MVAIANWETIHRPGVEGVQTLLWDGPPRVYGEVRRLYEAGALERIIYAIFDFPAKRPSVLVLRRDHQAVGTNWSDPLAEAKLVVAHEWAEECEWGTQGVLREMWQLPRMTLTERAAYEARLARRREEAKERAAKLLDERRHGLALVKGR